MNVYRRFHRRETCRQFCYQYFQIEIDFIDRSISVIYRQLCDIFIVYVIYRRDTIVGIGYRADAAMQDSV